MRKKNTISFKELVVKNKTELLQDKKVLEQIEKRLEARHN
ncbi:FbpB family small basic protein [Fictibacillus enclensis]|nr:FbpB family small basic protein [Fictibacillus enclensis]MDM5196674.1 FbpB family small basic protein [Fictibacillus enclensis]